LTTADPVSQIGRSLDLGQYRGQRSEIEWALTVIARVAECLGAELIVQDLHRTIKHLTEDLFKIVVVGHFSQGKSTVINALLGTRVLPSSPRPTTAILNRLRHSDRSAITLRYLDGSAKGPLNIKEFQCVVAPPEPTPGDASSQRLFEDRSNELGRIAFAEVEYPWVLCGDGVEIVDTPGTNDLDPIREKITYDFIPNSDAAIFVLSARAIAADSEIRFLKDRILKADIQRIFFVINFADVIARQDRDRVVEFARTQLAPIVPDPRIFLVSARAALAHRLISQGQPAKGADSMSFEECGYPELEQALALFLTNERGWIKLAKPREHGLRLAGELKQGSIAVARASVGVHVSEFTAHIKQLAPEIERLKSERDYALHALSAGLAHGGQTLVSMWRRGLEDIADQASALVAAYTGPRSAEDLARYIEGALAPVQTALHEQIRGHQTTLLQEECSRAQRRLASAWDNLYIRMDEIFDLGLETEDHIARERAESGRVLDVPGDATPHEIAGFWDFVLIGGLTLISLPFLIFETVQQERFLGRMRFEIDRRYRNGISETVRDFERRWNTAIGKTSNNFARECNQNLQTLEDQMSRLCDELSRQTGRDHERRRELDEMESLLDHAVRALHRNGSGANIS